MMNRHTRRAVTAALLASGLIVPAQATLLVPARPAIIKPAGFWKPHEDRLMKQLAMPLTMGMLAANAAAPTPGFRAAYSITTNLTTYNFTTSDLGAPDPARMDVVVVSGLGTSACNSVTVDGTGATSAGTAVAFDNARASIWRAASTANPTGTISVVFAGSMFHCTIGVYALYPASQTPVDYVTNVGSGTTIVISNLAKTDGGFTILHGQNSQSGRTGVITQNGAETIIEDGDAQVESLSSYVYAHHVNTATTTVDDYTITWSSGGSNALLQGVSWF